jgi:tetratricopeptide (TPR) repeat protein
VPELTELDDNISITPDVIQDIASFSKAQLENADRTGDWHACVADALAREGLYDAAIPEYRHAIESQPNWKVSIRLAEALGMNENFQSAIQTAQELIIEHEALLGNDDLYTAAYWNRILPNIGSWSLKQKDLELAESTFTRILAHSMEQDDVTESAQKAILGMLSVLNKRSRFEEAIALLDQCSNRKDPGGSSWTALVFAAYFIDDDFHNQVAVAAKRTGTLEQVTKAYEQAIGNLTSPDLLAKGISLQFYLATLLWTFGTLEQKEAALYIFDTIISHDFSDDIVATIRVFASRYLASALLSRSKGLISDVSSESVDPQRRSSQKTPGCC